MELCAKEVLFLLSKKHRAEITVSCLHNTTVWLCLVQLCSEMFWKIRKQKRGIRILYKKIRRLRMAIKYGRTFTGFNREWKFLPSTFTGTVFITAYGKRGRWRHIPMGMITPDCFGNPIVLTTFICKTKYDILSAAQEMIGVSEWQFSYDIPIEMIPSFWNDYDIHFESRAVSIERSKIETAA